MVLRACRRRAAARAHRAFDLLGRDREDVPGRLGSDSVTPRSAAAPRRVLERIPAPSSLRGLPQTSSRRIRRTAGRRARPREAALSSAGGSEHWSPSESRCRGAGSAARDVSTRRRCVYKKSRCPRPATPIICPCVPSPLLSRLAGAAIAALVRTCRPRPPSSRRLRQDDGQRPRRELRIYVATGRAYRWRPPHERPGHRPDPHVREGRRITFTPRTPGTGTTTSIS